jgi:vacuolar-type H+-ATPase subunit F/Vma7
MNIHVIGNQTLIDTFEVIGIVGHVIGPDDDVANLLCDLSERHGAELVLVQSEFASHLPLELLDELARKRNCLVTEVPRVNGPTPDPVAFRQTLEHAMGASI